MHFHVSKHIGSLWNFHKEVSINLYYIDWSLNRFSSGLYHYLSLGPSDQCHHGLVTVIFKPPLPIVPKSLWLLSLKRSWIFLNKTLTKSLTNSKKKNIQRHAYTTNIFMQAFTIIIFSSSWLKSSKHVCLQDFKG